MRSRRPRTPAPDSSTAASTAVQTPEAPPETGQTLAVPGDRKRFIPPGRRGGFGRQAGVPNKVTPEMKANLRKFLTDEGYQSNLMYRIESGAAPLMEKHLWEMAWGKPKVTVEVLPPPSVPIGSLTKGMTKQEVRILYAMMKRLKAETAKRVIDVKALPAQAEQD